MCRRSRKERIREQDPLKQGLKLLQGFTIQTKDNIREQDPLKQGLKPIPSAAIAGIAAFASKIH